MIVEMIWSGPKRHLDVLMDLTPRCNLYCKMCLLPLEEQHSKGAEMPDPVVQRIQNEIFPISRHVALSCGGEPFLAKNFLETLEAAVAAGVPHVSFVTNGILMSDEAIARIVDLGIRRVWVSVDGATAATYEKIRIGAKFDRLHDRLSSFARIRSEKGKREPLLRISWVMMRSNLHELDDLVDLAREVGVNDIHLRHLVAFEELDVSDELLMGEPELVNDALDRAFERGRKYGINFATLPKLPPGGLTFRQKLAVKGGRALELATDEGLSGLAAVARVRWKHRNDACSHPHRAVFIKPDGSINPCGAWYKDPPVGHLGESSYADIRAGDGYQTLFAEHRGEAPLRTACQQCPNVTSGRTDSRSLEARSAWGEGTPEDWDPRVPKILERARPELAQQNRRS